MSEKYSDIMCDLRFVNRWIHEKHHKWAEEYGLTLDQYHILIHLKRAKQKQEYYTIKKLAQKFNNAQNTMSEKISRMEKKELITRTRDENDRRAMKINISEKGIDLLSKIHNKVKDENLYSVLEKIDEDVINDFEEGLKKIVNKIKEDN